MTEPLMKEVPLSINVGEVRKLIEDLPVEWDTQLCVTSRDGEDFFDGVGSLYNYWGFNEWHFSNINSYFRNTAVERMLDELGELGYAFGRVRLMRMKARSCYSYHQDVETRMHFAITNDNDDSSMFIIDEQCLRIPRTGKGYILNTLKKHTAINTTNDDRINLVINLLYKITKVVDDGVVVYRSVMGDMTEEQFESWKNISDNPHIAEREDFIIV